MIPLHRRPLLAGVFLSLALAAPAAAQIGGVNLDTVRAGRFDMGRMWTFEYAPQTYFSQTYGFDANDAWFEQARMSALRIPGCSASFVSGNGLVVTNHHCVRSAISAVAQGEPLLDEGFVARQPTEERRIPNYWADQLLAAHDVSAEIFRVTDPATSDSQRVRLRQEVTRTIEQRLRQQHAATPGVTVQIVPLYQGGRYSAYVFRRFTDVRLVAAAELQTGFFGGDPDNFTYPRYALDFAFLRVYDENGQPHRPAQHFRMSTRGVQEGDVVFVIGNPGPTTRLTTMAQLEYLREVMVPAQITAFTSRLNALRAFYAADPVRGEQLDIRNRAFSISNSLKAAIGRLDALNQPVVMARRADIERQFLDSLRAKPALQQQYGDVVPRLATLQQRKRELGREYAAFFQYGSAAYWPAVLRRALIGNQLLTAMSANAPQDTIDAIARRLGAIGNNPADIERDFLIAQLTDFQRALGVNDTIVRVAVNDAEPAEAAAGLLRLSVLADSARTAAAVAGRTLTADDPAIRIARVLAPRQAAFARELQRITAEENELQSRLGRARFEIYGTSVPPDASSSPRITDGVVSGYEYNGTLAPPYTTFFGMYDRFHSFGPETDWNLPARWRTPPAGLDLSTPLNFVSTADTYGGNSGSPAVTKELELVGLNFDRNIQGLSRDYIFLPERGRNIMVDARAIRASLGAVYNAQHILRELDGQMQ